jgi:hypothetical protein
VTEFDPRVAATTVVTGPADLVGNTLVRVEQVTITGQLVHLSASLPGVPQYVAVARAEAEANALWPRLMDGLDRRGPIPYQPDAAVVIDFQAAVGSAIAGAVTGLEAFASHHLGRFAAPGQPVIYNGKPHTLRELRDAFSLNQRYADVMPAVMGVPRPTQEPWWPTLRRIQGLAALDRHAVTEPTIRSGLNGEKSLVQRFCDREYAGAAQMMLDVFQHFSPGWVSPERASQLPPAPES